MESKINYTLVGLFVVFLFAGLIGFIYWLGKYGGEEAYDTYHVYMFESVSGLSVDSSVKYKGVNVGAVTSIGLNPKNSEQVQLVLQIKHQTPIKVGVTATLQSFGLTGLYYVELEGGKKDAPLLTSTTDDIPVIPATPSTFARFDNSLSSLTEKSAIALDKFNRLLSPENLDHFSTTLSDIKNIVQGIRSQQENVKALVNNGVLMEKRIIEAFKKVENASTSVKKMADNLDKNSIEVNRYLTQDVKHTLDLFNQLLTELDILTGYLQKTAQGIEASPSDLIFKTSQPKPGPGEEGYHEE